MIVSRATPKPKTNLQLTRCTTCGKPAIQHEGRTWCLKCDDAPLFADRGAR